jgi:AcrR family transcriptional regulator
MPGGTVVDGADRDNTPKRAGRPRDAEIDQRIIDAATAVYAERGWTGFNFDVISRRANVSKDAIYRRYETPVDLLLASWSGAQVPELHRFEIGLPPEADIRDFLIAVGADHFASYSAETGFDYLRVHIEAKHHPEVLEAFLRDRSSVNVTRIRGTVRAAIVAGLLPDAVSPTAILDALIGGVAMHVMVTPPNMRDRMIRGADVYLEQLADLILRGCGYDFEADPVPILQLRRDAAGAA